ncbi:flagellar hook-associated protein FlgL [Vibrio harveyi]|nr:flagellar hook-associated protein FlgL [Vibrio harveyi]
MRLSSAQFNKIVQSSIQTSTTGINTALLQMSSGKKMLSASDDPLGSVQLMMLDREQSNINQYQKNISNLRTQLGQSESFLNGANNAQLRAQELVSSILNASNNTPEGREAIASELEGILEQLVGIANSQDPNGDYVLSGTKTETQPVVRDPKTGDFIYQGNDKERMVSVAEGTSLPCNKTAESIFFGNDSDGSDIFNSIDNIIKVLRDPTIEGDSLKESVGSVGKNINDSLADLGSALTDIGAQQGALDRISGAHEDNSLLNSKLIGDIENVDMGEVTLALKSHMAALQATQMTYTQIQSLSLFKMM